MKIFKNEKDNEERKVFKLFLMTFHWLFLVIPFHFKNYSFKLIRKLIFIRFKIILLRNNNYFSLKQVKTGKTLLFS